MRNVFFSHDYDDADLAQQILQCDVCFPGRLSFRNWREWEQVRLKSPAAIEDWIDDQLNGSTVTVVLIGQRTAGRHWVEYEIKETIERGNGLLGIYLDKMEGLKAHHRGDRPRAVNPFIYHPPRPRSPLEDLAAAMLSGGLMSPSSSAGGGMLSGGLMSQRGSAGGGMLSGAQAARATVLLASRFPEPPRNVLAEYRRLAEPPRNVLAGLIAEARRTSPPSPRTLADETSCYCWVNDYGYTSIADWIEEAARAVGK